MTGRPLADKVIVITGASSGLGRATALHCAAGGARLVLGARREAVVEEVAAACRAAGGDAVAAHLEVADPASVDALAGVALERFGQIDVWINNAGLYSVGRFEHTPPEVFDRILAVDLAGVVSGSRAALRQFRTQRAGTLINVSSIVGGLAGPYVSAYATAKWGVRGFSFALREELRDAPGIHVCVARPSSIDTPIVRHAANSSGRALKSQTPTYPPEEAARAIAQLIAHPRRELVIGPSGLVLTAAHALAPALVDRVLSLRAARHRFDGGRAAYTTDGNVFEPATGWEAASGGWPTVPSRRPPRSLPVLVAAAAGALAVARRRR